MLRTIILTTLLWAIGGNAWAGSCLEGDCRDGQGVYRWDDGSTFSGSFLDGAPDGEGEYVDKSGRKFHALYVDGQPVTTTPISPEEEAQKLRRMEALRYNEAGLIYLRKKDYESAIFFFNKAITLWPDNPSFHQNYRKAKERK